MELGPPLGIREKLYPFVVWIPRKPVVTLHCDLMAVPKLYVLVGFASFCSFVDQVVCRSLEAVTEFHLGNAPNHKNG